LIRGARGKTGGSDPPWLDYLCVDVLKDTEGRAQSWERRSYQEIGIDVSEERHTTDLSNRVSERNGTALGNAWLRTEHDVPVGTAEHQRPVDTLRRETSL
jgi:hypothetical protein